MPGEVYRAWTREAFVLMGSPCFVGLRLLTIMPLTWAKTWLAVTINSSPMWKTCTGSHRRTTICSVLCHGESNDFSNASTDQLNLLPLCFCLKKTCPERRGVEDGRGDRHGHQPRGHPLRPSQAPTTGDPKG